MASKNDKQVLIETIKANGPVRSFGYYEFLDAKHDDLVKLKELLKPDWDANSEKVVKKREEEYKKLEALGEELRNYAFQGEQSSWRHFYDITVMISKKDAE